MWKVFQTVNEMLVDRGYDNLVAGKNITTFDQFLQENVTDDDVINKQNMSFVCQNTKKKQLMMVFFSNDDSIGIKHCMKIYDKMMMGKIPHCILLYPNNLTSSAKKYLEKTPRVTIEAFSEDDLMMNITKHRMQPKYHVLDNVEKEQFYKESHISDSQLPRLGLSDPIAKYFGMRRGDVIQITRKSETAGLCVTYRICN